MNIAFRSPLARLPIAPPFQDCLWCYGIRLTKANDIEAPPGVFACALLGAARFASAQEFKAGDIVISNPWSRATPMGAKVGAGYLVIENRVNKPDRLLVDRWRPRRASKFTTWRSKTA
jgi:hypothetical protein